MNKGTIDLRDYCWCLLVLCTRKLGLMTTIAHCHRAPRRLRRLWCVVTVITMRLLGETGVDVCAQVNFASVYDAEPADSDTPASGGVSGQPPASLWDPFVQGWNRLQTQLNNRGIQFNIRYDGEGFSDISGGTRRGATYLGNLNLRSLSTHKAW